MPWPHALVPGVTGTDTGGSIRQPAALTGITGIKPTYGRCSRYGMIAFASSLDQAGPYGPYRRRLRLLLQAMSGFDERDATSAQTARPTSPGWPHRHPACGRHRRTAFGWFARRRAPGIFGEGVSADGHRHPRCAGSIRKSWAPRWWTSAPRTELSIPVYYIIAPAEASSNLSRFDGVVRPSCCQIRRSERYVPQNPRRRLRPRKSSAGS